MVIAGEDPLRTAAVTGTAVLADIRQSQLAQQVTPYFTPA
jgi:hypothetical protein